MADKRNSDRDEQVSREGSDEKVRGVSSEDADFDDSEDLDEEEEAEDEEGSTF
jgi:hypothetical protein